VGPRRDRHWILEVAVVVFGSDPLPFWMHVEREKFRVIWFVLAIYVARERERERERWAFVYFAENLNLILQLCIYYQCSS
jgi:hypothetical protein